jgi:hypothetical protein
MTNEEKNKIVISDKLQEDINNWSVVNITAQVPSNFSATVDDYHDLKYIQSILKEYVGLDYEYEQVGYEHKRFGECEAVFYIGPRPNNLIEKIKKTYE